MGIGFDVFKAHIGYNLADSALDAVSNAIEKNASEAAERERIEKETQNKNDMLKTLVFMVGNNITLDRSGKKAISNALSTIYDENISLFSIEDKIDVAYSELKSKNIKQFFTNIFAINNDRQQTCFMYVVIMLLYMELSNQETVLPIHAYNLSLIKRFFSMDRTELSECYKLLGEKLEKDIDDIADIFEELTSEESIKKFETENPTLIYEEEKLPDPSTCENPKGEVEKIFYETTNEVSGDEEFKNRFYLADSNTKKILAAVHAYAKNCQDEEILVGYDDSSFGNGKVGFLLTNIKLYICNSFEKPQEIELASIKEINANPKKLNSFITVNEYQISTSMLNQKGTEIVCKFLQKSIPFAEQVKVITE